MSNTTEVSPATWWRTSRYYYYEGGSIYGGELRPWIGITAVVTGVASLVLGLVGGGIFLTYKSDKAECEALARVRPEVEYEYGFWSGCVGGVDSSGHLDVDLDTED